MTLAAVPPTTALAVLLTRLVELSKAADELHSQRVDTELALLRQMKSDMDAGRLTRDDVDDLFLAAKGQTVRGFDERWRTELGMPYEGIATRIAHRARQRARYVPNGPGRRHWMGACPIAPLDPVPPPDMPVAYLLLNEQSTIYAGSTNNFVRRVQWHIRDGKTFTHWTAYPCATRAAAYEMEDRLIVAHDLKAERPARRPARIYREGTRLAAESPEGTQP